MIKPAKGITLLEMLVVLAIIMGFIMTVIPMGRAFYLKNQLENRVNAIVFTVKYAKQQALLRHQTLILRPLSEKQGWSKGMRLFISKNGDTSYRHGDNILREWHWPKGLPTITWQGFSSQDYLRFSLSIRHSMLNGHFLLALPDIKEAEYKKIIINRLGRIRTEHA